MPARFRPGEHVTTWLNVAGGDTKPLSLQQRADSGGNVYFNAVAALAALAQPVQAPAGHATLTGVIAAAGTTGALRLEGVQVNVVTADRSTIDSTATDTYGGYVLNGLPVGTYAVRFDPSASLSDTARRFQPSTQVGVSLTAAVNVQLDAELTAGSNVSGQVTSGAIGELADVSVELLNGHRLVGVTTTTSDGRVILRS